MNGMRNPVARKDNLVIQEMPDEVLVYDLNSNKAHCLNRTAAFVWRNCDGKNGVADIVAKFEKQGSRVNEELVVLALDQLGVRGLMESAITPGFTGQNRREVLKRIGLGAAVALPLVASVAAPTSVLAAASCACTPMGPPCPAACPSMICNSLGQCA